MTQGLTTAERQSSLVVLARARDVLKRAGVTPQRPAVVVHPVAPISAPGARVLEGWASTSAVDHAGDVLNPKGARYALPLPLLFAHRHDKPIGRVTQARVSDAGTYVTAELSAMNSRYASGTHRSTARKYRICP